MWRAAALMLALLFAVLAPAVARAADSTGGGTATRPDDTTTRIVSLMPNMTEIIFAIGADAQLVGDSDYCNWPDAAKAKPRVGGLLNPNLEKILLLRPTHAILHNSQEEFAAKLHRAGITAVVIKSDTLEELYSAIRRVGSLTGRAVQAGALEVRIRAEIADAANSVRASSHAAPCPPSSPAAPSPPARRPRVLLVMARDGGELRGIYAGGPATHLGEILAALGGDNVVHDSAHPSLPVSIEMLVAMNPEIIIDFSTGESGEAADGRTTREVWSRLPLLKAVQGGRVHSIADPHLAIPGPEVGPVAREFARILSGDDTPTTRALPR
jgi:iron complex transport system substrate-binding protein